MIVVQDCASVQTLEMMYVHVPASCNTDVQKGSMVSCNPDMSFDSARLLSLVLSDTLLRGEMDSNRISVAKKFEPCFAESFCHTTA